MYNIFDSAVIRLRNGSPIREATDAGIIWTNNEYNWLTTPYRETYSLIVCSIEQLLHIFSIEQLIARAINQWDISPYFVAYAYVLIT